MNSLARSGLLILVSLCLASCSRTPSWLRGTFEFDVDATMQAADAPQDRAAGDSLIGAVQDIARALGPIALSAKYGGTSVTITDTEYVQLKGGSGNAVKFDVFDHSTTDVIVIKDATGEVTTWKRTDHGIALKTEGFWLHYKRVK